MTIRKLLLALTAFVGVSAFAQAPLGTVTNVQGVVTATQGATGMTVTPGTVVQNGMRFVTTSNASMTLRLNSGCTVNVPAGHGVTVLQTMTCQQLVAAVQPVVPVAAAASSQGFAPAAGAVNVGIVVVGALITAAIIEETANNDDQPLSGQ
jgi:hypothetical protein